MYEIGIEIVRHRENDTYYDSGLLSVNNGVSQGDVDVDWEGGHLKKIGRALRLFPKKVPDEYSYGIDSDHSTYFAIRAYTDKVGHTNLEITMQSSEMGSKKSSLFL